MQPNLELGPKILACGAELAAFGRPRPSLVAPLDFARYVAGSLRDIRRLARERQVSVIHCHLSDAEFLGVLATLLFKLGRVVLTAHTPTLMPERSRFEPRNLLRRLASWLLFNRADRIVAVSDETARHLERDFGVDPRKISVVINGVDVAHYANTPADPKLRRELGLEPEDRLLLCVGRLTELSGPKGQIHIIRAMPEILAACPRAVLGLAGDGEGRADMESAARELGVFERVRFWGRRSDVAELLALAEIFVMPSVYEGSSLALVEAMAAGKCILATDIPGNRHLVAQGREAWLVAPGNPQALAQGALKLLGDPELARVLAAKASRLAAERYDFSLTLRQLEAVWG